MATKGCTAVAPDNLIVTTDSQQTLDLLGKILISPGDKVIVEGPTFFFWPPLSVFGCMVRSSSARRLTKTAYRRTSWKR